MQNGDARGDGRRENRKAPLHAAPSGVRRKKLACGAYYALRLQVSSASKMLRSKYRLLAHGRSLQASTRFPQLCPHGRKQALSVSCAQSVGMRPKHVLCARNAPMHACTGGHSWVPLRHACQGGPNPAADACKLARALVREVLGLLRSGYVLGISMHGLSQGALTPPFSQRVLPVKDPGAISEH